MTNITIPFDIFLDLSLGILDKLTFDSPELAAYIASHDPEERFIHLEGNTIWRIADWKIDIERITKIKALSEKQRYRWCRTEELRVALARGIESKTSLHTEICKMLASQLIEDRNSAIAKLVYGVDISELEELDKEKG